ncbi:TPA: NAD-dependent ubiquitin ligase [Legionella pneumophila]|nr:NAD-dependent ubiquitin ligase [Legionella pneumophila]HAU1321482.1 NAD-dependent ubiquitin ligase [Legionella pneumophila]HBC0467927.1 NAD-dependent ubiquitin ligase [Legionella pneumophila]HBD9375874.1 NAD-dependent ubiquitin ligase [Legionella pneumophila]HBI2947113.1 NAD-dependent ubiquitin ligase [Legionella pneumophila]
MPLPVLDFSQFVKHDSRVRSPTSHNNKVIRGTIPGNEKTWIAKEMNNNAFARNDLLAQEFFRLIIPHQPETRIARNEAQGTSYIYSEEIQGYRMLPEDGNRTVYENGTFTGLGQAILVSVFTQELDLKNGNIGLDENNRIIKIDGDQCFGSIMWFPDEQYHLTPEVIEALPFPNDFYAYNWLDMASGGRKRIYMGAIRSNFAAESIKNNELFRAEVNQAMLKICLLPDKFIENFVDTYIPTGGQRYIDLIKNRRDILRISAVKNQSFRNYLSGAAAQDDASNFLEHMRNFQAGGEPIVADEEERSQLTIELALQNLKSEANFAQESAKLTTVKNNIEKEAFADQENGMAMVFHFQMEMKKQAQLSDDSFIGMISRSTQTNVQKTAYQNFLKQNVNPVMDKCFKALVKNDLEQLEQVLEEFPKDEKWSAFNLQESIVAKAQMDAVKRLIEERVYLRGKILPALEQCKDAIDKKDIPSALEALSTLPTDEEMNRTTSISSGLKNQIKEMKKGVTENLGILVIKSAISTPMIENTERLGSIHDPLLVEINKQIDTLEKEHLKNMSELEIHLSSVTYCLDTLEILKNQRIKQHGTSEEPIDMSDLEKLKSRLLKIKEADEIAISTYSKGNTEIAQNEILSPENKLESENEAGFSEKNQKTAVTLLQDKPTYTNEVNKYVELSATQPVQELSQTGTDNNSKKRTIKSGYNVDDENRLTKVGEQKSSFKPG